MLGENLKILRKRKSISQEDAAKLLGIPRSSYSGYENGVAQPSIELLIKLADSFKLSVDVLIRQNLSKYSEDKLSAMEQQLDLTTGNNLRVLVTTTDNKQTEMIELITESAKAGYADGYADPDFIKVLPAFNLPFVSRQKKCRAFPISGDSMPPVNNGSFVVAEYLENWRMVRDGFPYIIVTKNEGIVFKIIYNHIEISQSLQLCSTNPIYQPYEININEILEIWKFVNYISSELEETKPDEEQLTQSIRNLQREVADLKSYIKDGSLS